MISSRDTTGEVKWIRSEDGWENINVSNSMKKKKCKNVENKNDKNDFHHETLH
jgi:hypothetical protein